MITNAHATQNNNVDLPSLVAASMHVRTSNLVTICFVTRAMVEFLQVDSGQVEGTLKIQRSR